jgi:outer membrane beta-barrel protein
VHRALVVAIGLLVPGLSFAQVEELENPGSVAAIQDRAYRMQHELGLSVGILPVDAFTKGLYAQVAYTVHFSDSFAWTVGRGAYVYSVKTGLREQLERDFGVLPTNADFDAAQFFVGSDLMWTPFYGKMSVLNKSVVHGEFFLLLGASLFKFTKVFRPGINWGGGVRLFASQWVSFRLDVTDTVVLPVGSSTKGIGNVMTLTLSLAINFGATE